MRKLGMDELNRKSVNEFRQSEKTPVVVVLDNIRSMHNVGSVFRTADAFLVEGAVFQLVREHFRNESYYIDLLLCGG